MNSADALVEELKNAPAPPAGKPAIQKVRYTHEAMIDLIVGNPWISQNDLAAHFGYTPGWISTVIASDAFQEQLAKRREEVVDPGLKATIEERFRALVIRSLEVLQQKLNQPQVNDQVALRAAELGAKALGIGGNAPPRAPTDSEGDRLERLAERLVKLQSGIRERTIGHVQEAEILEFKPKAE